MTDCGRVRRALYFAAITVLLPGCATVPELGMITDRGGGKRRIEIRLGEQKAYLFRDGSVIAESTVSTGREGYGTPSGRFRVIEKDVDHRSSLYGQYVKNGRVVKRDVDVRKSRKPAGAKFVGAPMPYFLRVTGAVGMHAGHVPGYPASHGCIRLPPRQARRFFHAVEIGTPVSIIR